jgi:hypothetical protein
MMILSGMLNRLVLLQLSLLFLFLSACEPNLSTAELLEQRSMARWDAVINDKLETAYEYLSPGFRSSVSLPQYQRSVLLSKVNRTAARYVKSSCEETSCNVKISLDFTVYKALPGVNSMDVTQTIEESWVLVEGSWYYVPEN